MSCVIEKPAICYTVRNGWAWAHIYVRHGIEPGAQPRHWVNVSVQSDYGDFGYCWSHISAGAQAYEWVEPDLYWRRFLANLSFHYAMTKLFGAEFEVDMPIDMQRAAVRNMLWKDQRGISRADRTALFDALALGQFTYPATFLVDLDREADGAVQRLELWDRLKLRHPNPQAAGFWKDIWPLFIEHIMPAAEMAVAA